MTRAGRPPHRVIRAGKLTAGLHPIRTVLSQRRATVVVVLDARTATDARDGCETPAIGGDVEPVATIIDGARRFVVCRPHPRIAQPAIELDVEPDWLVAGVIGVRGRPRDWAKRLRRDPAALPAPVGGGAPDSDASYRITRPRRRSR